MKLRNLGLGALTAVVATVGLGVATATAHVEYTWYQGQNYGIAYQYTYYADAEKTEYLGTEYDSCTGSYDEDYAGHALHPYIPTAYFDEVTVYHCGGMGPELLPNFSYGS